MTDLPGLPSKASAPVATPTVCPAKTYLGGIALLTVGSVASAMLVLEHFGALELPGCGHGSPCERAANSVFGTVPVLGLPTSFIGLAYFTAALIGWVAARGTMSPAARWASRLSALLSLAFIAIVVADKLPCVYCLTVHAANLLFVLVQECSSPKAQARAGLQLGAALAVFVVGLGTLGVVDARTKESLRIKAEHDLAESTRQMIGNPKTGDAATKPNTTTPDVSQTQGTKTIASNPPPPPPARPGFTGRHRFGPEKAVARIVMFTDYQCPDCYKLESDLKTLMSQNPNISVIIKNFPLCTDCNPKSPNLHANACWAARAAITAGMLRGDDGFWQMHHWLFEQRGSFTDQTFPPALAAMGFDPQQFTTLMQSEAVLEPIKADIDEAFSLGIYYTPMIFINGVELKGWTAPNALPRAVQGVLAANPTPDAVSADHPPTALERYMSDWRDGVAHQLSPDLTRRAIGRDDAPVTVVVFGDYQEPGTQEVDGLLRMFAGTPDFKMRYVFANFPVDQSCNPSTEVTKFAGSCRCSLAAEAADIMAGPEAFWKMHDWVMSNRGVFTDAQLTSAAVSQGLDADILQEAMKNPATLAKVQWDARAGKAVGIQSIPMIFINGKNVPRWKLDNENLLPRMIQEEAARLAAPRGP